MNYRHAFHAGNFADVLKHIVLVRILEHLKAKPTPFRFIDLHAGIGLYDLTSEQAARTGEWRGGVARLYRDESCAAEPLSDAAEALIGPWRKAVAAVNDGTRLARYPGSPEIARRLTRESDRLTFNELHPDDFAALAARFAREQRARISQLDAWSAVKASLPPPERRGVVLMDPPYESANEVALAVSGLAEAHRRFATGVFCLWYPVKAQADANALCRRVAALGLPKTLRIELTVRRADHGERLHGAGLIVVNPPWLLEAEMQTIATDLAERLADPDARFAGGRRVEWLVGEDSAAARTNENAGPEGRVRH